MVEGGGKYDKPSTHFLSDAVYVKRINNEEIIATHEHVNFTQTHTYAHDAQTCGYFTHHARVSRGDKKEFAHVLYDTTRDKHTHTHTHTHTSSSGVDCANASWAALGYSAYDEGNLQEVRQKRQKVGPIADKRTGRRQQNTDDPEKVRLGSWHSILV